MLLGCHEYGRDTQESNVEEDPNLESFSHPPITERDLNYKEHCEHDT